MKRLALLLVVVVGVRAGAQQRPAVFPCPAEVLTSEASPAQLEAIQKEYRRQLSASMVEMPAKSAIANVMGEVKQRECSRTPECLQRLAATSNSLYALGVVATRDVDGAVEVTGRVVRADGKVVFGPVSKKEGRKGKESMEETFSRALTALFGDANLGMLPATKEVEASKPDAGTSVAIEPASDAGVAWTPPPPPPVEPPLGKRLGYMGLAGGGGLTLLGLVLYSVGAISNRSISGEVVQARMGESPEQAALAYKTARSLQPSGLAVMGAGAAVAAASVLLLVLTPDTEGPKLGFVIAPGLGSFVTIQGELP